MIHQNGRKKLNLSAPHRRSLIRNQAISFILHGSLISTRARVKTVRSFVEKLVTLARKGSSFNAFRRVKSLIPYSDDAVKKLFAEIAPQYTQRPGGYTRVVPMAQRISDTAEIAKLEWVS